MSRANPKLKRKRKQTATLVSSQGRIYIVILDGFDRETDRIEIHKKDYVWWAGQLLRES